MNILVAGKFKLGGFEMRGRRLAKIMNWDLVDVSRMGKMPNNKFYDMCYLVKYDLNAGPNLRESCDRFVWDPLDAWMRSKSNPVYPTKFWQKEWERLRFDDIIATSPSCAAEMCEGLVDKGVHVHIVPHHSDQRVNANWYNPNGPIVYVGGQQYIRSGVEAILKASELINRRVVFEYGNTSWKKIKGASLVLTPRLYPFDTPINRTCKPQVKVANALAAGCPVVSTDDPCTKSLYDIVTGMPQEFYKPNLLVRLLRKAYKAGPSTEDQIWSFQDYKEALIEALNLEDVAV